MASSLRLTLVFGIRSCGGLSIVVGDGMMDFNLISRFLLLRLDAGTFYREKLFLNF